MTNIINPENFNRMNNTTITLYTRPIIVKLLKIKNKQEHNFLITFVEVKCFKSRAHSRGGEEIKLMLKGSYTINNTKLFGGRLL